MANNKLTSIYFLLRLKLKVLIYQKKVTPSVHGFCAQAVADLKTVLREGSLFMHIGAYDYL